MRALLLLAILWPVVARAGGTRFIDLFGTTDRHGQLEPQTLDLPTGRVVAGGAAMLGGFIARARAKAPGRVLLVDSGDLFQGTMASNLAEGAPIVDAMNALGFAATAVGNHEFDFGPVGPHIVAKSPHENPRGALEARIAQAHFPFLLANLVDARGRMPFFAYTLVEVDHVKIGLVGGVSEDLFRTTLKSNLRGLTVLPLADSVVKAAHAARAHGAQVVVALVHAGGRCPLSRLVGASSTELSDVQPGTTVGCEDDSEVFQLARALGAEPGLVNAIFAGHTHQIEHAVVAGIPITQGAPNGVGLAEISIEVDATGRPTGHFLLPAPRLLDGKPFLGAPVAPDQKIAELIRPALARAQVARAKLVGITLPVPLPRAFTVESPLGNLVADVIRASTHAEIGLMNGGGLRADLPAGPVTYGALFEVLPFDNHLAVVEMTGAQLRALVDGNLHGKKGVLSVSGMTVHAHCTGARLTVELVLEGGKAVDDRRVYRVGTNDFLALGGDDFGTLHDTRVHIDEPRLVRDEVALWLAQHADLDPLSHALYNPAAPRLVLPTPRPLVCPQP